MASLNKKSLEHLAELARLEFEPHEEEKLLRDLQRILDYFEELKTLDTSGIEPMSGGTSLKNVFREDEERQNTDQGEGIDAFPETREGFLEIPPVFK